MNIFEYATRNKVRFPYKGMIGVEDLWDLSLKELDVVYKSLNSQMKKETEASLLSNKSSTEKEVEIMIEIVRFIFDKKTEERNNRLLEKENSAKKQKIMDIISKKQDESLQNMSIDDLQKMLETL